MKLTEEQLAQLIKESTEKILKEYAYHERQNKKADSEDNEELKKKYNEWMAKKNASKKAQSKKDDDDEGAIDYYDYKHGRKGNFKPMTNESIDEIGDTPRGQYMLGRLANKKDEKFNSASKEDRIEGLDQLWLDDRNNVFDYAKKAVQRDNTGHNNKSPLDNETYFQSGFCDAAHPDRFGYRGMPEEEPMEESRQITASQLQNYITESVRRIVKERFINESYNSKILQQFAAEHGGINVNRVPKSVLSVLQRLNDEDLKNAAHKSSYFHSEGQTIPFMDGETIELYLDNLRWNPRYETGQCVAGNRIKKNHGYGKEQEIAKGNTGYNNHHKRNNPIFPY